MNEIIGYVLYQSCGNRESVGRVSVCGVGGVGGEWVGGLEHGMEKCGGVMCV